jgi:hypothetical protein
VIAAWVALATAGVATAAGPGGGSETAASHANGGVGQGQGQGNAKHESASPSADHSAGNAGTSGDASEPQPPSNADQNPGGANGDQCSSDPAATYCSTRDGSPSENGNGGGAAVGKPCAGCVGKADNKNPPGQETQDPRGTFPDNGYECDNNNGIGKTNPAHTGCQAAPPAECDETVEDCGGGGGGGGECDEAVENCGEGGDTPDVEGTGHHRANHPPAVVLGEKTVRPTAPAPGALPFTGAELGALITLGIAGLSLGVVLLAASRRPRRSAG